MPVPPFIIKALLRKLRSGTQVKLHCQLSLKVIKQIFGSPLFSLTFADSSVVFSLAWMTRCAPIEPNRHCDCVICAPPREVSKEAELSAFSLTRIALTRVA